MKKIKNEKILETYLSRYQIRNLFSDSDLPFELYTFERGETINNILDGSRYIQFVLDGVIRITHVRDDGTVVSISEITELTILGDIEFAHPHISPYLVECVRKSTVIALPLQTCRKKLENDPVFLRNLLGSVAAKFEAMSLAETSGRDLKEKVLYHLRSVRHDHMIRSVSRTASELQCSSRQLLRILKKLCAEGILEKTGKGSYRLL